jgi:hypothetical protein
VEKLEMVAFCVVAIISTKVLFVVWPEVRRAKKLVVVPDVVADVLPLNSTDVDPLVETLYVAGMLRVTVVTSVPAL